jgi:hypothetical protein
MRCSGIVKQERCKNWVCEECYEADDAVGIYPDPGEDGCYFFICSGCEANWEPHGREVCFAIRLLHSMNPESAKSVKLNVNADIVVSMTFCKS